MRAKRTIFWGLTLVLACAGAFAGTVTIAGSQGDTDDPLDYVTYSESGCSFELPSGSDIELSEPFFFTFPEFGTDEETFTLDLVWNAAEDATEHVGFSLLLNQFDAATVNKDVVALGTLEAFISASTAELVLNPAGGSPENLITVTGLEMPTQLELVISTTEISLRYGFGSGLTTHPTVIALNSLGSLGDITDGVLARVKLSSSAGGSDWLVNQLDWEGTVPDINQSGSGCDESAVPNFLGLTQTAAETDVAANALLELGTPTTAYSETIPEDSVVDQNPAAGTPITESTTVSLVISLGTRDTDNDGLDDDWEVAWFGDLSEGRWGDPDGDRRWNIYEFQATFAGEPIMVHDNTFILGTNPLDATSAVPAADRTALVFLGALLAAIAAIVLHKRSTDVRN